MTRLLDRLVSWLLAPNDRHGLPLRYRGETLESFRARQVAAVLGRGER